jgi:hypothetical protein
MCAGVKLTSGLFLALSCALLLSALLPQTGTAQQYLGNARQRCQGPVTVTTSGGALQVRPFEARSAEVGGAAVRWQCPDQQQAGEVPCPAGTNKVLIDRSQGGSIFSIICLQK